MAITYQYSFEMTWFQTRRQKPGKQFFKPNWESERGIEGNEIKGALSKSVFGNVFER